MIALEPHLRRDVIATGRQLADLGFVTSTYGSISALLDNDLAICTPAGVAKSNLSQNGLVKMYWRENRQVGLGKPTSSFPLHAAIYGKMQTGAIVHAQPPAATSHLRAKGQSLADGVGELVSLGVAKVLVVGGACASRAAQALSMCHDPIAAVFVNGLGLFTWGKDVAKAMTQLESLEKAATVSQSVAPIRAAAPSTAISLPIQSEAKRSPESAKEHSCGCSSASAGTSCTGCGRCANSGGVLPSARQEAIKNALDRLSTEQLVALVAEAAREVLHEKGLL